MLRQRFLSALVIVPVALGFTALGGSFFAVFTLLMLLVADWEYGRLLRDCGFSAWQPVLMGGTVLLVLQRFFFGFVYSDISILIILAVPAVVALVRFERGDEQAMVHFALHVAGILYFGWLGSYAISLRALEPGGMWRAILTLGLAMLVDVGAYAVGSWLGRHAITPRLSPNKTWEGYAGGIVFGVIFGALFSWLIPPVAAVFEIWQGALLGLVLGAFSPIGDVFISLLKRTAGVKQSGTLMPGHGGVLDRIDSWLWAMMLGYYLILLIS